ncbi:hypothetical protein ACOKM5_43235 [Streptomyces sp. BH097]|uniref:hypothetical protein n=1 Tax=unclassified Streptomyces TaxID=2593676 RepID=UPI003BB6D3AB
MSKRQQAARVLVGRCVPTRGDVELSREQFMALADTVFDTAEDSVAEFVSW